MPSLAATETHLSQGDEIAPELVELLAEFITFARHLRQPGMVPFRHRTRGRRLDKSNGSGRPTGRLLQPLLGAPSALPLGLGQGVLAKPWPSHRAPFNRLPRIVYPQAGEANRET